MQSLMASRVGADVDWDASQPRNIVTEADAREAVIQVAAVIDEALQGGQAGPPGNWSPDRCPVSRSSLGVGSTLKPERGHRLESPIS